jgi:hypothetical protein
VHLQQLIAAAAAAAAAMLIPLLPACFHVQMSAARCAATPTTPWLQ